MVAVLKKYSGVLFFYLVIVSMILIVNARFASMEHTEGGQTYALKD